MSEGPRYHRLILGGLVALLVASVVIVREIPLYYYRETGALADIFGFLALAMIVATGVLMVFKKQILARTRNPGGLRLVHVVVAGLGGVFLVLHAVLFLLFPLSLPVLLGYVATGVALLVWITGIVLLEELRTSLLYHGLFSLVGVFLILLHTFAAGRNIPVVLAGISLSLVALVVLFGAAGQAAAALKAAGVGGAGRRVEATSTL
jgi:hypothetical protein